MKFRCGWLVVAAVVWLAATDVTQAQCRGGGGGSQTAGGAAVGWASSGGGEMLTSPGSWAYDRMMQQVVMQAYARRQAALAVEQAEREAEQKAARQATHQARRQSELARRARYREFLAASARQ